MPPMWSFLLSQKHQCQAPPQGWALNAFTLTNSESPFQTMTTPTQHERRSVVSDSLQSHGLYTVHGILQDRRVECVAFSFSR